MSTVLKVALFSATCVTTALIGKALADPPLYQHFCLRYNCTGQTIGDCSYFIGEPDILICTSMPMAQCNLTETHYACLGSKPDDTPCQAVFSLCTGGP
jgi:hypothetical protein